MNINLANIDFVPGQGGGGSLTPEEQEALDTLVNSSEGVLYTSSSERYHQYDILTDIEISSDAVSRVFWNDVYTSYYSDNYDLYKLNRESYQFEMIAHFNEPIYFSFFFEDKSYLKPYPITTKHLLLIVCSFIKDVHLKEYLLLYQQTRWYSPNHRSRSSRT